MIESIRLYLNVKDTEHMIPASGCLADGFSQIVYSEDITIMPSDPNFDAVWLGDNVRHIMDIVNDAVSTPTNTDVTYNLQVALRVRGVQKVRLNFIYAPGYHMPLSDQILIYTEFCKYHELDCRLFDKMIANYEEKTRPCRYEHKFGFLPKKGR